MKRILAILLSLSCFLRVAVADTCGANLTNVFTSFQAAKLCATFIGTATLSADLIPGTDNSYNLGSAAKQFENLYLGTNLVFGAASAKIIPGATSLLFRNNADSATNLTITDAGVVTVRAGLTVTAGGLTVTAGDLTSTAGDLIFSATGKGVQLSPLTVTAAATPVAGTNQINPGLSVFPTAAANTAAILGPSTPVPGQQFVVYNSGPNTVRIKAGGGATMNGATAGGYMALTTLTSAFCFTTAAGNYVCQLEVNPTPAGP